MPERGQFVDRLACGLERDRLVEHERSADRVDDGGALITDDEIGDACLVEIGPYRAEHPPRGDDDGDPGCLGAGDRGPGAWPQQAVTADERAVESQANAWTSRGNEGGKDQPLVACVTYAATSAIC